MYYLELKFKDITEHCLIKLENNLNSKFFLENLKLLDTIPDHVFLQGLSDHNLLINSFKNLANTANTTFGFMWDLSVLSKENFNKWHKDIESFHWENHKPFSESKGKLIIDLHHAMHNIEYVSEDNINELKLKINHIQIKWYNKSKPWPQLPNFIGIDEVESGDIIADYGHVGKTPFQCWKGNDNTNLQLTCKLPTNYCPGFYIQLSSSETDWPKEKINFNLINWYLEHKSILSTMFSLETMLQYTGVHKLGTIENKSIVPKLQQLTSTNVEIVSINC